MALVGFLLDDADLIFQAIHHPERGIHRQMAEGVTADGQWWEGAWGYHFYTMDAVWPLVEAAKHKGMDLYGNPLKRMFDGPVRFATPGMKLPAFNDSHEVDVLARGDLYELGYARYGNDQYLEVLTHSDRQNNQALWFGASHLPPAPKRIFASTNYPRSGYAILSRGQNADATWLCFKYGPHGGGHGHPDKLNFVLAAHNEMIGMDPGTCKYGLPVRPGWYKTTFSHNVLIVDETEQASAEGKFRLFERVDEVDCCIAEAGPIYEGVRHLRLVALVDENTIVFVGRVLCDEPRLLDIAYHHRGSWTALPGGTRWIPPDKDGYRYLQNASARTATGITLRADVHGGFETSIVLAPGPETQVITATGMGDHTEDRVPVVVFRRRAKETVFVWAISLLGQALELRSESEGDQTVVWLADRRFDFCLGDVCGVGQ